MEDVEVLELENEKLNTKLVGKFDPNAQMLNTSYFSEMVDILKELLPKLIKMRDRIELGSCKIKIDIIELRDKVFELEERVAALENKEQPI